ncbi:MAG: serine hydrolase domain-containing protein [Planctomycetota bacterium]
MVNRFFSTLVLSATGALPATVLGQSIPLHHPGAEDRRFTTAIEASRLIVTTLQEETGLPGLSVAVNLDGAVVWEEGFGHANLELRAPATARTRYRLASISKAVTGVAVAALVEDGVLDLDQPIETILDDCPAHWHGITVRHLMGHTAGIRSYTPDERDDLNPTQRDTVEEALDMIRHDPLEHEPGERYTYTTLGYIIVRAVIETLTEQEFMRVVFERVLEPAGMLETGADRNAQIVPNRSTYYHFVDGEHQIADARVINAPHINISYKPAGGGMVGTPSDLTRLGHALADCTIISRDARDTLWTPTVSNSGEEYDYGLGWGLATDTDGVFYGVQIGGQIGAGSAVIVYPDHDVSVSLMANRAAGPVARSETVPIARLFRRARDGETLRYPSAMPVGFYDITITDQHERTYAGRLTLAARRGLPSGELLVQAADNPAEFRRFRVATAIEEPNDPTTLRIYTVHQDWGLFPFVLTFAPDGRVTGELDRQVEHWAITGRRAELVPELGEPNPD